MRTGHTLSSPPGWVRCRIKVRAVDDSANLETQGASVTVTRTCPCTLFADATPAVASASDTAALELGTRFTVATAECRDRGAVLQGVWQHRGARGPVVGMAVVRCWPR